MSSQSKELVAATDAALGMFETPLKQLTVMFNRIAIPGLSVDFPMSSDVMKRRAWLAELGILFDLDAGKLKSSTSQDHVKTREVVFEDFSSFTTQAYGMTLPELHNAREDKEKFAGVKKRADEYQEKLTDGSIDPMKMWEFTRRMSTNMFRMLASQLRDVENVDAYPVISYQFNSFEHDDPRLTKYDVVKISLGALPAPAEYVPWEQIIDYRNDPDTKRSFLFIKEWMSEVARGTFNLNQIEESLEYLVNQFRRNLETHHINTTTMGLEAYVVTNPEFLEMLAGAGRDFGTRALFTVEHRKIGLFENELTAAGSEVAFLMPVDLGFPA